MMAWTARGSMVALSMASMRWEENQEGSGGGKCRLYSAMLLWDEMSFAAPSAGQFRGCMGALGAVLPEVGPQDAYLRRFASAASLPQ